MTSVHHNEPRKIVTLLDTPGILQFSLNFDQASPVKPRALKKSRFTRAREESARVAFGKNARTRQTTGLARMSSKFSSDNLL
jgi:hypothetical protein